MALESSDERSRLLPYVPRSFLEWAPSGPDHRHRRVSGTLAFVDISGFTRLTERLSRQGKVGAEEMSDILDATFAALMQEAVVEGADLVKWGGDAVLLLFDGLEHAVRAARAAHRMRATLSEVGRIETSSGVVVLRMSVGVHSGDIDLFLVGDPELHQELLVVGPAATVAALTESAAEAGQIGLSAGTTSLLPTRVLGAPLLDGRLLRALPALSDTTTDRLAPAPGRSGLFPAEALSPPVRRHLSEGAGEAEHRGITVAFVQFSGTDDLLEREGPSVLADALDHLVRGVQHACDAHGVTFFESDINADGGKIMLTAGAPSSLEHPEERMLRVVRSVLDGGGRLSLRVGVNRGHVFAGDFGPAFRRTYSVKGDAINLAARLLGRAAPGQGVATTEVVLHSRTRFESEPLAPFTVKGKAQPVQAVVVGPELSAQADVDVPVVGRAGELAVLTKALAGARQGSGAAVQVLGDAGTGKTRLLAELLGAGGARSDVRVMDTRCDAYQSSIAYYPFRRLLRQLLDLPRDPAEAARQLESRIAAVSPELVCWAPLLGIALDVAMPDTPQTAELDPQFRRTRLETLVVELLSAALSGACVIAVEDVHHADGASVALLRRLATAAVQRPWLVLATSRVELPELTSAAVSVRLGPLGRPEAAELARCLPGDRPLTPHALGVLVDRSGGNPFFLRALVQAARTSGDLAQLPDSIESLVASDVDRLSPSDRRALRYAAVLGSVVDQEVLALLMAEHGGVDPALLGRLEQFLVRGGSGRLRFRSVLLRDVAYEGLPYRRRRALHDRVGSVLEHEAAEPEDLAETLSLHFFHAGNHAKAWRYSVVAGTRALDKHGHGEAATFFERAASAVPRDGSVTRSEHAAVVEQLAEARFILGDTERAGEAYAEARRLLRDDPVGQALLVAKQVRVDVRRRRFPLAMRRLSEGLRRLEGVEGSAAEAARALLARRYAYSRFSQGRIDEALRWAEAAARYAEESADKPALAQSYEMLNAIYAGSGRDEPLPYGLLALQANCELNDLPPQGHCLNNLAVEAFRHGRWDEALTQYGLAADIFRRIGDAASEGNAAYNRAELLVRQGHFVDAAALLPEVVLVARAVEDTELVALALREQAQTAAAMGDAEQGLSLLAEARQHFERLGLDEELLVTDLVRVEALAGTGQGPAAGGLLAELVPAGGREQLDGLAARWSRLSALVLRSRGELEAARAEILTGLRAAASEQDTYEEALLLRDLVVLSQLQGLTEDPDAVLRSQELLDSMGVVRAG